MDQLCCRLRTTLFFFCCFFSYPASHLALLLAGVERDASVPGGPGERAGSKVASEVRGCRFSFLRHFLFSFTSIAGEVYMVTRTIYCLSTMGGCAFLGVHRVLLSDVSPVVALFGTPFFLMYLLPQDVRFVRN